VQEKKEIPPLCGIEKKIKKIKAKKRESYTSKNCGCENIPGKGTVMTNEVGGCFVYKTKNNASKPKGFSKKRLVSDIIVEF